MNPLPWLRRPDSNRRPLGYEPNELPLLHSAISLCNHCSLITGAKVENIFHFVKYFSYFSSLHSVIKRTIYMVSIFYHHVKYYQIRNNHPLHTNADGFSGEKLPLAAVQLASTNDGLHRFPPS